VSRAESPSLAELQRRFFQLVTAPEGVAEELAAHNIPPDELASMVVGDRRASAVERLDVYANMYFYRILDVLRTDYPKLLAVVGDAAFHNLATDYLVAHPSRHPSLRFVGSALPGFVASHALGARRPWLAELAALEWARVDVFDRADVRLLTRDTLAARPPEAFAALALGPIPAHELVTVTHDVEETWRVVEGGREPEPPRPTEEPRTLLVWRRGVTVHHRLVDEFERAALELVRAGTTFGLLCSALGARLPSEEEAAARAAGFLGRWLADELLVVV
jgi:hypothetical protein